MTNNRIDPDSGFCEHGTYVGGCGIDWMCGWCEEGIPWNDYVLYHPRQRVLARVKREELKMSIYMLLREHGTDPQDIAYLIARNVH